MVSTPAVAVKNAWLDVLFAQKRLVSVSLMFNASPAETAQLFNLLAPRIAKAQTLELGHFWYIPPTPESSGQYVFWGPFDHGWRYRDWQGPPPQPQGAKLANPRR